MPKVMIKCPGTGKYVPVGIAMDRASFENAQFVHNRVQCPYCGDQHLWSKKDAYLIEERPASGPGSPA